MVVAVLFAFLGNLRAAMIVAMAIPLSMLFAFAGMLRFGISASLLSLGAIDFGMIVDSSVVMVENCVRHIANDSKRRRKIDSALGCFSPHHLHPLRRERLLALHRRPFPRHHPQRHLRRARHQPARGRQPQHGVEHDAH